MGRQAKKLPLTIEEMAELEIGYKSSSSETFRRRCHIILLKNEGRTSKDIGKILRITDQAVNNWVKRYKSEGINGLYTKPGRGKKPILSVDIDGEKVKEVIKEERQRLKYAKILIEEKLDKEFSLSTLKRFLKNLSAHGSASA